jgi:PAS domain S-box-containing protein
MSFTAPSAVELSVWLLSDAAGVIHACAPGAERFLGRELRGCTLAELFGEPVARGLLSGLEEAVEWMRPASSGGTEPTPWRVERHRLAEGGLLVRAGAVRGLQEEVPAAWERRLSRLLASPHGDLAEQQRAFMLSVFDADPNLIFVKDRRGRFIFVNRAMADSFITTPDEMVLKHNAEMHHDEEELKHFNEVDQRVLRTQSEVRLEESFTSADGKVAWYDTRKRPLRAPNGETFVLGISVDITVQKEREAEQERLREDLRRTNEHLERLAKLKDEFLANMSHELRTPLNAVLGQAEAMSESIFGPVTEEQRAALRTIEESGRHLLSLINDVLDISKSTVGHLELELEAVPVEDVCQESLRLVREQARRKRITVSYTSDGKVPTVWADRRRLRQVLLNLLSNAKKFTPEGGHIGLEAKAGPPGTVAFTIWDTGPGIPEKDRQRIFEPFVQLDAGLDRHYEGSGLGLALVRRLVALHSGGLELDSEIGKGSRFTVVLPVQPLVDTEPIKAPVKVSRTPVPLADSLLTGHTVLIADDNESNTRPLADYLRANGFQVRIARDGEEALRLCREVGPAVVLMDIQMPRLNGLEAIRQLRSEAATAHLPMVALTALAMPGDRERCMAAGADAYLSKPARLGEVLKLVRQLTSRRADTG